MKIALMALAGLPADIVMRLSDPLPVSDADVAVPVSAALRAATIGELKAPLEKPAVYRFICLIAPMGAPEACILDDGKAIPKTWSTMQFHLSSQAFADEVLRRRDKNGSMRIALEYAMLTRLKPFAYDRAVAKVAPLRILTEVVYPADNTPVSPAELLPIKQVQIVSGLDPRVIESYYPFIDKDPGLTVRVSATCRILPDHGIACRDGKLVGEAAEGPQALSADAARKFVNGTYQALSLIKVAPKTSDGVETAGKDVIMTIRYHATMEVRTTKF